ncbi:MAG TPA: ABC transporter permease [Vicinamibacterales bacterium]
MFDALRHDLRYAVRTLRRSPGFTAIAVLSLALGIGANTAIFSIVDVLWLRSLPVTNPDQLVAIRIDDLTMPKDGGMRADFWSYVNHGYLGFVGLRDRSVVFSDIAAIGMVDRAGVTIDGTPDPAQVRVALVSGSYFRMYGVTAALGRALTPDDDRVLDGHPVAVISNAYWTSRFARRPDIVGRTLALNGVTYTVLGVAPRSFSGDWLGRPTDIWIPIMMQSEVMLEMPGLLTRYNGWVRIVARLKAGVTLAQADAATKVVHRQLQLERAGPHPTPETLRNLLGEQLTLVSAARGYSPQRATFAAALSILVGVVGFVLLIVCANVANLLLARASSRRREISVRLALGASRGRIVQQLLTEGLLLALCGGALGALMSLWATAALAALPLAPVQMDSRAASAWMSYDLHPDLRVLAFSGALCVVTAILFTLAPALRGSNVSLVAGLTQRGASATAPTGRLDPGKVLVIGEVALSFVLLVAAGLFARTLRNLSSVDLGLDRKHTLLVWTAPGQTGRTGPALATLCRTIVDRLAVVPGVESVSASNGGLLIGTGGGVRSEDLRFPGRPPKPGQITATTSVMPGYFATVGLPLLAGRDFNEHDTDTVPRVQIVNETFARFFFGNANPIGRHFGRSVDTGFPIEIVGVVKDTKYGSPRERPRMWVYSPYLQGIGLMRNMQIAIHVADRPMAIAGRVRQELQRIDPALPVLKIDTIDGHLADLLAPERLTATFATCCSALATAMACLGLYAVIAYTVSRRRNEIGVRLALGATRARVFRTVSSESAVLVLIGLTIGASLAFALTRLVSSQLFGVTAADPMTFLGAALLTVVVVAAASLLPAHQASRTDPMIALRTE